MKNVPKPLRVLPHCFIPHNAYMPPGEASRCLASASRWPPALILCLTRPLSPSAAEARTAPCLHRLDHGNVPALAIAYHLLQAWQSGDVEDGITLLSRHAKDAETTDVVEQFFISSEGPSANELGPGKLLKRGRYEFPAVLISGASKATPTRCRFSSMVVHGCGQHWQ